MSMKRLITSISIVLILTMSFSCQHDQQPEPNVKGDVLFSFSSIATKAKSMMKSSDIDNAASIIISIKNSSGILVYNLEQLTLIKINGSFITRPISLLIGNYELTQFIVADAQGNALFVAPIQGSPNAYLVSSPLPIAFTIAKDEVVKIVPEVIDVENSIPEDFGYSTFSFTVVETFNFLVSVFVYNAQVENFELTTAALSVSSEGIVLYSNSLQAITNQVTIRNGYDSYILNISKDGYKTFIDTLTNAELKLHFRSEDNGPLVVILEEDNIGCTMGTVSDIDGNEYRTVKIGEQWWMAENLKVTKYRNGNSITTGLSNSQWENTTSGAYTIMPHDSIDGLESDAEVLAVYGALYNWHAVDDSRGLCPTGWHVSTDTEWSVLVNLAGGASVAGAKLREMGFDHWVYPNIEATNELCFTALPSGWRTHEGISDFANGGYAFWWSASSSSSNLAFFRAINTMEINIERSQFYKEAGYSIRCVKD